MVQPKVISLFSGGGGLHLGFNQAGFKTLFASDFFEAAAATFAKNLPEVPFHLGDIRHLTPSLIQELTQGEPVDVVIGGPPCQGFSTLGDQIQGDPRNSMFEAFARIVRWTNPKCVLIENTSYLRAQYGGRYEQEIRAILSGLGYRVYVETLNAADYGTPQIRKRVFFFATRLPFGFRWPSPTHGESTIPGVQPYRTVGEAIMDLVDDQGAPSVANHVPLRHSPTVIARYQLIPEGGRLPPPQELPEEIRRRNFGNTYKRLHRRRPSMTLVPGNNAFPVHPTVDRSLTPREAARLQGFPDDYVFAGSRAEQCKLVGNAVPVDLARSLGAAVLQHMHGLVSDQHEREAEQPDGQLSFVAVESFRARRGTSPLRTLRAASFFTGAGGLMLGFMRAGFDIVASYDRKGIVSRHLGLNFPGLAHFHVDLDTLELEELKAQVGSYPLDVVFGGPPCQGFSIFGKRRFVNTRGHQPDSDPRNELTLKYIDIAIELSPKVIFMENVKGLVSTPRGASTYIEEVTSRLASAGYSVQFDVVNSADYGVPQLRERLLMIATKPGIVFDWPEPKFFAAPKPWQRPHTTVGDVISDLADPSTYGADLSHVPMNHKELLVARYEMIPEGGKLPERDLPEHLKHGYRGNVRNYSHVHRRLSRFAPATTMVPGHNAFPVHPTLPRSLTVREAARIQTFPDTMRFVGTRQQQCLLVGNAVPPLLAEVFAQSVVKAIRGNNLHPGYKADHYELKAAR